MMLLRHLPATLFDPFSAIQQGKSPETFREIASLDGKEQIITLTYSNVLETKRTNRERISIFFYLAMFILLDTV